MDVIKTQQVQAKPIEKVIVHPLVLLSIVDNYTRVAKDSRKRVIGVLLGSSFKGTIDVTNSYAVPFEEDDKDSSIWFLDHNYHESMFSMFKRINAKEHVVGWYSTGPKLRENDLDIHQLFHNYVPNPVLVIIDVQPKELGIPTKAYYDVEEVKENATQKSQKVFVHVPSEIAAHEVEEIGVEHLLRDVKDTTISTLATEVTGKLTALKGLDARLREIRGYLDLVIDEKLPLNHEILYHLQDVFNLLPNLNVTELIKGFAVKTNDMMLVIYLSSLIRSVIALHNLINNKILNKEHEKAEDAKQTNHLENHAFPGYAIKDDKAPPNLSSVRASSDAMHPCKFKMLDSRTFYIGFNVDSDFPSIFKSFLATMAPIPIQDFIEVQDDITNARTAEAEAFAIKRTVPLLRDVGQRNFITSWKRSEAPPAQMN
ncbi:unnamed protein product [Dovyalis caffra]|uniref:MPN domain-containing protein n=1 Tax=Dovyalis caffra TaxID=77055 RepID=A0AAV1QX81_9ROSI|nr:unnamed protein product [Dovyalis caffra]